MATTTPRMSARARDRLVSLLKKTSRHPDGVERTRAYADSQADDEEYKNFHFLADLYTDLRNDTRLTPEWADYQPPPRRPTESPDAPALVDCRDTKKEETAK